MQCRAIDNFVYSSIEIMNRPHLIAMINLVLRRLSVTIGSLKGWRYRQPEEILARDRDIVIDVTRIEYSFFTL